MIRINLLPIKEKRRRATGQRSILVIMVLLGLESLALFMVHNNKAEELAERQRVNTTKKSEISKLKREIGNVDNIQDEKKSLEQQQGVLDSLEMARGGPVRMLAEMMFLLTPPVDARARLEIERRRGQPNWDPKRVWIRTFVEQARQVSIIGEAKSNDDVAEFLQRLSTSDHFQHVKLLWTKQQTAGALLSEIRYVRFSVTCVVTYSGRSGKKDFVLPTGGMGH